MKHMNNMAWLGIELGDNSNPNARATQNGDVSPPNPSLARIPESAGNHMRFMAKSVGKSPAILESI